MKVLARLLTLLVIVTVPFFFFFQAEDGIRDTSVTGVQTCALPILPQISNAATATVGGTVGLPAAEAAVLLGPATYPEYATELLAIVDHLEKSLVKTGEIGRASCRERV